MHEANIIQHLLTDLLIIISAGFVAGIVCKRLKLPMVVGYLLIGALIGSGILGLLKTANKPNTEITPIHVTEATTPDIVTKEKDHGTHKTKNDDDIIEPDIQIGQHEVLMAEPDEVEHLILDQFAHLGANLLLFAIGIHFSPSELIRLWRYFIVGGSIQMIGVILPFGLLFHLLGYDWKVGIVLGSVVSLSSTVLVFKSLEDMGQATSLHGLRAVAILLFQDVAVVPLLVLIGILAAIHNGGADAESPVVMLSMLVLKASVFIAFVVLVRYIFVKIGVPFLLGLRNVELIVLFTMILLIGVCCVAGYLGLPGALGALAVGVVLSDTRLTHQVTAITVAMRETFSAIFFVSLGALFDPNILFMMPVVTLGALLGCLLIKTIAAGAAFRVLGLPLKPALAMGLGLSQLGELSFVLTAQGYASHMFDYNTYQIILFVALTSIILTPAFLKLALNSSPNQQHAEHEEKLNVFYPEDALPKAIVVGLGPIGGRVVTYLETAGFDVGLIDMNPVNLHPYAQQGFRTIAGNAADEAILKLIDVKHSNLAIVTVPDDLLVMEVVNSIREMTEDCIIIARCRYSVNVSKIEQLGANLTVCGETELGHAIVRSVKNLLVTEK